MDSDTPPTGTGSAAEAQPRAGELRQRQKMPPPLSKSDLALASPDAKTPGQLLHAQVAAAQISDILNVLLMFRFINALCVRTFFQPDEYFQALEPAWDMAFGNSSGAWLTWVLQTYNLIINQMNGPGTDSARNGTTNCALPCIPPSSPWPTRP
jgi:hypothetical protein